MGGSVERVVLAHRQNAAIAPICLRRIGGGMGV
jgi:hypothetical protein